jgi:hypothetical protein
MLSPAGQQLFAGSGMGDMLQSQREDETDRLRRLRQAQAGRPDLGGSLGYGTNVLAGSPMGAFGMGRMR